MSFAEYLGFEDDEMARVASGFGGGMFHGDVCGCVSGAIMALGLMYGHEEANDWERKEDILSKVKKLQKAFEERCGSIYCRKLVPFDFALEGEFEKAMESEILFEQCPGFVLVAIEEVQKIVDESEDEE